MGGHEGPGLELGCKVMTKHILLNAELASMAPQCLSVSFLYSAVLCLALLMGLGHTVPLLQSVQVKRIDSLNSFPWKVSECWVFGVMYHGILGTASITTSLNLSPKAEVTQIGVCFMDLIPLSSTIVNTR